MPIRPIDLQTLLMQMSQVGRDQAVEKDGPVLQNAIQGAVIQKKEIESKESIRKAEEAKDGTDAVRERGNRGGRKEPEGGDKGEGEAGEGDGKASEEVVRDPTLGNRVDLTG